MRLVPMNRGFVARSADHPAATVEQRVIAGTLVSAQRHPQRLGHRDGHQEVMHRQQPLGLLFEPGGGLLVLASRAVPVATRSSHPMPMPAGIALVDDSAQLAGPATGDRREHFLMDSRHPLAELFHVSRTVGAQCLLDTGHAATPGFTYEAC